MDAVARATEIPGAAAVAPTMASAPAQPHAAGGPALGVDAAAPLSEVSDGANDDATHRRKRAAESDPTEDDDDEGEGDGDGEDDNGDYGSAGGKDDAKDGNKAGKRSRRHNWQAKYEMEFGLLAIERDAMSGDVTLAMCGFCKAFGREGKYEQLMQTDVDPAGTDNKKRRRRSLTTTKFFRAFRVDNIRSHLQGAHPRRWAEYELLPKQDAVRARYLQMHGDFQYDNLPIDDVVLTGSSLAAESEMAYAQAQAHALGTGLAESHHTHGGHSGSAGGATTSGHFNAALVYNGARNQAEHEKHLLEQLALDRERLNYEKQQFKKEVELRERELAQREKMLAQERELHEKRMAAEAERARTENDNMARLAESIRDAVLSAIHNGSTDSVV